MDAVQKASADAVRDTLKSICQQRGRNVFEAEDFMDDGSRLKLKITVDPETGNADFDFNGTSPQAHGKQSPIKSSVRLPANDLHHRKLERTQGGLQLSYNLHPSMSRERGYTPEPRLHPSSQTHTT